MRCHRLAAEAKLSGRYQATATLVSRMRRITGARDPGAADQAPTRGTACPQADCGERPGAPGMSPGGALRFGHERVFAELLQLKPVSSWRWNNALPRELSRH